MLGSLRIANALAIGAIIGTTCVVPAQARLSDQEIAQQEKHARICAVTEKVAHWQRQAFDDLISFANGLRNGKSDRNAQARQDDLDIFYDCLRMHLVGSSPARNKTITDWFLANKSDPTAQITTAMYSISSIAREQIAVYFGRNERSEVRIDKKGLEGIATALAHYKDVASTDAYYHRLVLEVALFRGVNREEFLQLYNEAVEKFPGRSEYPIIASQYFHPRWYGEPGELQSFAETVAKQATNDRMARQYALIQWKAAELQYGLTLFKHLPLNWAYLEPSIHAVLAQQPHNIDMNKMGFLSCLAGDRALTGQIMNRPGFESFSALWQDKDALRLCWNWSRAVN